MSIRDLILKNRSYRRFDQSFLFTEQDLRLLVELARFSPSGANMQPLKYILSWHKEKNARIFPCLAWAGYLREWGGPAEGERPTGYIIILGDDTIRKDFGCDHGIAAQSILLGATEKGWGGCMIGSIQRDKLRQELAIPEHLQILLVIALGKPAEMVILQDARGDIKYYRDSEGIHYVPKRPLKELIIT